jgi:hypothetical protein
MPNAAIMKLIPAHDFSIRNRRSREKYPSPGSNAKRVRVMTPTNRATGLKIHHRSSARAAA